jgi:hypothetical protein
MMTASAAFTAAGTATTDQVGLLPLAGLPNANHSKGRSPPALCFSSAFFSKANWRVSKKDAAFAPGVSAVGSVAAARRTENANTDSGFPVGSPKIRPTIRLAVPVERGPVSLAAIEGEIDRIAVQLPSPGKLALSEQVMRRVPAITGIVADRRRKRAWDGGESLPVRG